MLSRDATDRAKFARLATDSYPGLMRFLCLALAGAHSVLGLACKADASRSPVPQRAGIEKPKQGDANARYVLRFAGVPVGMTELALEREGVGYRFRRNDTISVRRDGERVESVSSLIVELDEQLSAKTVNVMSNIGTSVRSMTATRDEGGWMIRDQYGGLTRRSGLELVETAMLSPDKARTGEPMLVAGANFARIDVDAGPTSNRGYSVLLRSNIGEVAIEISLDADGLPGHWGSASGESAERVSAGLPMPEGAELLDLAAMPSRGRPTAKLVVDGATREPPLSIAGQTVTVTDSGGWSISFQRRRHAIPADLAALVEGVDARIEDDLSAPGLSGREALRMGRGDCSGHASALAVLANENGYPAKVATGFRRRGNSWLRHRWTVALLGDRWVSLDPSFGETKPRANKLLILAVHEPSAEAMALADLVAFAGMGDARAQFK